MALNENGAAVVPIAQHRSAPQPNQATDGKSTEDISEAIVLVEPRLLMREILCRGLQEATGRPVLAVASVEEGLRCAGGLTAGVFLFPASGVNSREDVVHDLAAVADSGCPLPCVVLADGDDPFYVIELMNLGARGYIPTNVPMRVAGQIVMLVAAGGLYVPAATLLTSQPAAPAPEPDNSRLRKMFTTRQAAVVEALRKGKANKIIAYELNMRESTVKVHVRNIMKKLKARNRTEAAYRANELEGVPRLIEPADHSSCNLDSAGAHLKR